MERSGRSVDLSRPPQFPISYFDTCVTRRTYAAAYISRLPRNWTLSLTGRISFRSLHEYWSAAVNTRNWLRNVRHAAPRWSWTHQFDLCRLQLPELSPVTTIVRDYILVSSSVTFFCTNYFYISRKVCKIANTKIYLVHQHFLLIHRFNFELFLHFYKNISVEKDISINLVFLSWLINISISILFYANV